MDLIPPRVLRYLLLGCGFAAGILSFAVIDAFRGSDIPRDVELKIEQLEVENRLLKTAAQAAAVMRAQMEACHKIDELNQTHIDALVDAYGVCSSRLDSCIDMLASRGVPRPKAEKRKGSADGVRH